MKNFFVKNDEQAKALEKSVESFGKQEISFLDNVVGGNFPTCLHYPHAQITIYTMIILDPPQPPKG